MFGMVVGEGGGKGKGLHSIGNSPTSVRVIFLFIIQDAGSTNCWVVLCYLNCSSLNLVNTQLTWVASGWMLTVFLLK